MRLQKDARKPPPRTLTILTLQIAYLSVSPLCAHFIPRARFNIKPKRILEADHQECRLLLPLDLSYRQLEFCKILLRQVSMCVDGFFKKALVKPLGNV